MNTIQVTSPLLPEIGSYMDKLRIVWEKRWMTNDGQLSLELRERLQQRMGCSVELFVNGHMALDIAVKALGLQGEVITTPYTFASTVHAVVMNGCRPVFCDIRPEDYTIDPQKIEALITEKTSAILPVHVYGCVCDFEVIQQIADRHRLKVIYDAAHAFDVTVHGKPVASLGDVSMYSFHATKVFNTIEGGALAFRENEDFRHKIRNLRNFGIENAESVTMVGLNAKMNEFAAAMGLCNLEIVGQALERRKWIIGRYREALRGCPGIMLLDYDAMEKRGVRYNYAYMPVCVDPEDAGYTRDQMADFLAGLGIGTRKYFYPLVPDFACYRKEYGNADVPNARRAADRILTLPLAAAMTDEEVERVCDGVQRMAVDHS